MKLLILLAISLLLFVDQSSGIPENVSTYVSALIVPHGAQIGKIAKQEVHLYPGWTTPLEAFIHQTMVPEVGSNLTKSHVLIRPGPWGPVDANEDLQADVFLPNGVADSVWIDIVNSKPEMPEELTTFPHLKSVTTEPTNPTNDEDNKPYVRAIVQPREGQTLPFSLEEVHLYPNWNGTLTEMITGTLVPEVGSKTQTRLSVRIYPGFQIVHYRNGLNAFVRHSNTMEPVTIYFILSKPEVAVDNKTLPESDRETFVNVFIGPRFDQKFYTDEEIHLYPGFDSPLKEKTSQIMVPQVGSSLVPRRVDVFPGNLPTLPNEGLIGNVYLKDFVQRVMISFDDIVPKEEIPVKTLVG